MKNSLLQIIWTCVAGFSLVISAAGQKRSLPQATMLTIIKAEDERRFDNDLQKLLESIDALVRRRAALAAGRIGDEKAVPFLSQMLAQEPDQEVRVLAAFALGEIESTNGAEAILKTLQKPGEADEVRARAVEAAGKIAAANLENDKAKAAELGKAILSALEIEYSRQTPNREIVLLGLTAALRAKPDGADSAIAKFLNDKDARIRADALNALARLKSKNANVAAQARALLAADANAIVRANAARVLGANSDVDSLDLLVKTATNDADARARIGAIRALANSKNQKAGERLLERGENLLAAYKIAKVKTANPSEKNELLEIATALGIIFRASQNNKVGEFLIELWYEEAATSPEANIALARFSPIAFYPRTQSPREHALSWQQISATAQGVGESLNVENIRNFDKRMDSWVLNSITEDITNGEWVRRAALKFFDYFLGREKEGQTKLNAIQPAIPDVLRAYVKLETEDLSTILQEHLKRKDVIVRATAAELLGEQPASKENIAALQKAFEFAFENDKEMNDAQLAILSALVKLDKKQAVSALITALNSPDFLVRRYAATLIKQNDLAKLLPNIDEKVGTIRRFNPVNRTKLGQVLNTEADYIRAISRRNGKTKAVVTTEKGAFTIDLLPEDAPLTVDNFIKLAKSNYFNNTAFHRVVPNFVAQGGDPRGDGNGGPGWQIRDEINLVSYERGTIGMALSGKDTGGSQWFVTHSPQPHLDGGYTVFGRVQEDGMNVADKIARGDLILNVKIIENDLPQKSARNRRN